LNTGGVFLKWFCHFTERAVGDAVGDTGCFDFFGVLSIIFVIQKMHVNHFMYLFLRQLCVFTSVWTCLRYAGSCI